MEREGIEIDDERIDSASTSFEVAQELREQTKERIRVKEISTEDALFTYLIQQRNFPNSKQYALLWKQRATDKEDDKEIKKIKLTIDYILHEEKEYEEIFNSKITAFERNLPDTVRRYSDELTSTDSVEAKVALLVDKLAQLISYWKLLDTSYKERI